MLRDLGNAHELPGGLIPAGLFHFHQQSPLFPFKILLFQKQEAHRVAKKIQNIGLIHTDAEEGVECGNYQRDHEPGLGQSQNGQQNSDPDDGYVPQLPEPQGGLCLQVFRVDKNCEPPPMILGTDT